jgi:hypothetical protein
MPGERVRHFPVMLAGSVPGDLDVRVVAEGG